MENANGTGGSAAIAVETKTEKKVEDPNAELKAKLVDAEKRASAAEETVNRFGAEREAALANVAELEKALAQAVESRDDARGHLSSAERALADQGKIVDALKSEVGAVRETLESKIAELSKRLDGAVSRAKDSDERLAKRVEASFSKIIKDSDAKLASAIQVALEKDSKTASALTTKLAATLSASDAKTQRALAIIGEKVKEIAGRLPKPPKKPKVKKGA